MDEQRLEEIAISHAWRANNVEGVRVPVVVLKAAIREALSSQEEVRGVCDECGEPLVPRDATWYHRECDLKRDEAKEEELRSLREERDALHAQLRGVGIVPYLDRMKELAEARDEALALMKRDQPDMFRAMLADQVKQDELRARAECAERELQRLREGMRAKMSQAWYRGKNYFPYNVDLCNKDAVVAAMCKASDADVDALIASGGSRKVTPPVEAIDYDALDSGIRDIVKQLREAGFETTDSGDGVSKPVEERAIDCLHVAAVVRAAEIVPESRRFYAILGADWHVEATYFPQSETTLLLGTLGAVPQVASERDAYAAHMGRHAPSSEGSNS